jgi:hypothetical protein
MACQSRNTKTTGPGGPMSVFTSDSNGWNQNFKLNR